MNLPSSIFTLPRTFQSKLEDTKQKNYIDLIEGQQGVLSGASGTDALGTVSQKPLWETANAVDFAEENQNPYSDPTDLYTSPQKAQQSNQVSAQVLTAEQYKQSVGLTSTSSLIPIDLASSGVVISDLSFKINEASSSVNSIFGAQNDPFSKMANISVSDTPNRFATANSNDLIPKATARDVNNYLKADNAKGDESHLVTLTEPIPNSEKGLVLTFRVMPEIIENRSVSYEPIAPPQFPGAFQKYKGTDSVQWSVNATFVSRTSLEASINLNYINRLRGWTMPYFGDKILKDYPNKLGAPPPVLRFKGFRKGMIEEVPVVITSLSWNWPKDVDYIPASTELSADETEIKGVPLTPFPTIIQVAIQLIESFSTTEFNQFSLKDYRSGNIGNAYRIPNTTAGLTDTKRYPQALIIPEAQTVETGPLDTRHYPSTEIGPIDTRHFPPAAKVSIAERKFVSGGGGDFGGGGDVGGW